MSEYMERQVRLLALHNPTMQAVVSMYDAGYATWEQAMTTAAIHLAQCNASLLKIAVDAKMREPVAILIDTKLQR
jgi:hypothetical protein